MKEKRLLLMVVLFAITLQGMAQSATEQANRIGLIGFWRMTEMSGKSGGQEFVHELDGSNFYIFKNNGTCQYTKGKRIADARWTLKGKQLHMWGKDTANDPEGIDHTFILVMVTPETLVLKLGDGDEYVYTTFSKSKATLKQVKGPAQKGSSNVSNRTTVAPTPVAPAATTSQSSSATSSNSSDAFDRVDQMPSFPGGGSALMQYLSSNVRYPKTTASGRVVVTFVVERDGSISNTKVVRSIDPALDREAVRVVSSMPNWNPGMKDGKPVRVKYTIPINFSK